MTDLAPPRERLLKAIRVLVSDPDALAESLLNAIEGALDEHDAAVRVKALREASRAVRDRDVPYLGHYQMGWLDAGEYIAELAAAEEADR